MWELNDFICFFLKSSRYLKRLKILYTGLLEKKKALQNEKNNIKKIT